LPDLGKGAKDSSSYLVAGSYRSFSQDSWGFIGVTPCKANDQKYWDILYLNLFSNSEWAWSSAFISEAET